MKSVLLIALIMVLSIPGVQESVAQERDLARVHGKVVNERTKEPLIGANIAILGTSMGTTTNLNGEYMIPNLAAGTYTIVYRYIGFKNAVSSNIELNTGDILELNVGLNEEAIMGEEVVISVQAIGQRAAINQQLASNAITNIVSSEKIRDVPDVNAAESIGRLPGVSLKRSGGEGDKVVIRGLSPQYSIIEVDGVRLSGNGGDRGVGLSSISSEMLGGIELSKSLTADRDADAIGGIVNLRTRVADKGLHYNIATTGAYNSMEQNLNNYKISGDIGNRFFENKFGVLMNLGMEQIARSSDKFGAGYSSEITPTSHDLYTNNAEINEQKRIRHRKNGSLVLDYKTDFMKIKLSNFYSQNINENEERVNQYMFNKSIFQFDLSESRPVESIQSHSLNSQFNIFTTRLDVNLSYSKSHRDNYTDLYKFEDINILSGSTIKPGERLFAQPSTLIDQYYPNEIMSMNKTFLTDNVRTTEVKDDITKAIKIDWRAPFRFGSDISGTLKVGVKYTKKECSSDKDQRYSNFGAAAGGSKLDVIYDSIFPYFLEPEDLGFVGRSGIAGKNFEDPDYDYGEILNSRYDLAWSPDLEKCKAYLDTIYDHYAATLQSYHPHDGIGSHRDDYTNIEELFAGYVMAEINIGENLMLLPGIRFENMHTEYSSNYILQDSYDPSGVLIGYPKPVSVGAPGDTVDNRDNKHWFPSINAKYNINEWISARVAYYRSTARPDYALLSPSMVANDDLSNLISYNPYLKPALANNYDLAVSFFSNKLGLFTVNAFYKEISGLIYRLPEYKPEYFNNLEGAPASLIESLQAPRQLYDEELYKTTGTKNNNMPINNPNKSRFRGIELSWQTNFWYLPGLLRGLVLDLNYSLIWSETELPYIDFRAEIDSTGFIPITKYIPTYQTRKSRMLDQPSVLWNARIGWDYKGFSSRISFRYQGETITRIDPLYSLRDEKLEDAFRIDISLKQQITEGLSCTMDMVNITQFVDDRNVYALDYVLPRSGEYYGYLIQLGLKYAF